MPENFLRIGDKMTEYGKSGDASGLKERGVGNILSCMKISKL